MSEEQPPVRAQPPAPTPPPEPSLPRASQAELPPDTAWVSFDSITGSGAPND